MKAKDRYSTEGLMAHRQRVMTGPNAEAVKRKAENAKKIAAITRRLKQGTAREERPHFGMEYAAKSILSKFDLSMFAARAGSMGAAKIRRPAFFDFGVIDFDHMKL